MIDKIVKHFNEFEDYVWSKKIIPIKASTLAKYYWCSRESYITFIFENSQKLISKLRIDPEELLVGKGEVLRKGIELHGGIKYGFYVYEMPIPPKDQVYELAAGGSVIPRNLDIDIGNFQIQGAVDEIRLGDHRYIIKELKTTRKTKIGTYILAPAEFQVKIYGWILSNYLPVEKLELEFIHQDTKKTIHKEEVPFNEKQVENEIIRVLRNYKSKRLMPPKPWKCEKCKIRKLCESITKT